MKFKIGDKVKMVRPVESCKRYLGMIFTIKKFTNTSGYAHNTNLIFTDKSMSGCYTPDQFDLVTTWKEKYDQ